MNARTGGKAASLLGLLGLLEVEFIENSGELYTGVREFVWTRL